MRVPLLGRSHRKGVYSRVACDIEIHILLEAELILDFIEQVVKVPHKSFLDLEAVPLHDVFPIISALVY